MFKLILGGFLITILSFTVIISEAQEVKQEQQYSPFNVLQICETDAIALAALDDKKLPVTSMRYVSLHNYPKAKRKDVKAAVDLTVSSLNVKYRNIVRTATLPANSDDPIVVRVNLDDYGISPEKWDILVEKGSGPNPVPEPYFHSLQEEIKTVPTEEVTYAAEIIGKVVTGTTPGHGQITLTVPDDAVVFIDDVKQPGTGTSRLFTTAALVNDKKYVHKARIVFHYLGQTLEAERDLPTWSGWNTLVSVEITKVVTRSAKQVFPKKPKKIYTSAPLLAIEQIPDDRGKSIANLINLTSTKNPIIRGDWFIVYAAWAPAYYHLLGLNLKPNPDKAAAIKEVFLEKDFEKLFNFKKVDAEEDIIGAVTDTKIVTLHNRIVLRYNTLRGKSGGYYWKSQDTDKGTDDEDYLNDITVFNKAKIKAQEIIASGRNGFNIYALTDANGVLLNVAAASIAIQGDKMPTKFIDKQVYAGRNCMLCHAGGQIILKDKVRNIAQNKIALLLAHKTKDVEVIKRVEEAFSPNLKELIDGDNAKFLSAVLAGTGREGKAIGKIFEDIIFDYFDSPVTLNKMAWEVGIDPTKLDGMLREGINLDHTLTEVIQNPPEDVARVVWEQQGYDGLTRFLLGYTPKKK